MIKYINRIIYALLAAMGLMIVFNLTDSYARTLYLEEKGQAALAVQDYESFISVRFYRDTPVVDIEVLEGNHRFVLKIYEVAYIQLIEEKYIVFDGLYFLMHQQSGNDLNEFFTFRILAQNDLVADYMGFKVLSLPLYSVMDEDTQSSMIKKDQFVSGENFFNIIGIEIYQDYDLFVEVPVLIQASDFSVKAEIEAYILENNEAPNAGFGNVSMAPVVHIDTTVIVLRNIAIYMGVVIVFTVLVFSIHKKRMGRREPTEGVKRDIQKIDLQDHKKR